MMILDTEHVVILLEETATGPGQLSHRLRVSGEQIATTVITLEEILRGWLAEIRRLADTRLQINPYSRLQQATATFAAWNVVPWDLPPAQQFEEFRHQKIRVGSADLKTDCVALVHSATLLTWNLRDLCQIPNLRIEDWFYPQS
ncbi:MAG: type II toxin-antitoxin system VapC family toxin [Pirellulaceae bacterium]|nr:type II toxin-antitoxin system VapC family toxin [Pirellulaceae bacterium]